MQLEGNNGKTFAESFNVQCDIDVYSVVNLAVFHMIFFNLNLIVLPWDIFSDLLYWRKLYNGELYSLYDLPNYSQDD